MSVPTYLETPAKLRVRQKSLLQRLQAPRSALQCRIEVCERILAAIQARLQAQPQDPHQLFLLEENQRRHRQLNQALRQQVLQESESSGHLESFVAAYVQDWDEEPEATELSPEQTAEQQRLQHERQTWEQMVHKVRERLVKKPGDPMLMRLLGEHQARLLSVQEGLHRLAGGEAEVLTVFEKLEQVPSPPVAQAESPEVDALRREQRILEGMLDKTHKRLEAKPELLHLKALIARHSARLMEIQNALRALTE